MKAILLALSSSILFGQAPFEVASVKPNSQEGPDAQGLGSVRALPGGRLSAEKVQLRYFIQSAYGLKPFQISGGPGWIDSAHYDIDAKAEGNASWDQMRPMMQTLLEDRFKLKVRRETRDAPVYELTAAKNGRPLPQSQEGSCITPGPGSPRPPLPGQVLCGRPVVMITPSGARMQGGKVSMTALADVLSNILGRPVLDKTGFAGTFDVKLEFVPDQALAGLPRVPQPGVPGSPAPWTDPAGPSIFSAIQEQLGLKLESAKGPVEVIIIDRVERPSGN